MNHEEEKKKELEKIGEDNPQSGREFPDSGMHKDQRKDAEKVKNESTTPVTSGTEDSDAMRSTGTSPNDQAGVADIDRGMDRATNN